MFISHWAWPKTRNGKKIRCPGMFKLSILQKDKWQVGQTFEARLLTPSNIPPLGYGWIYRFLSRLSKNHKQYEVTINDYFNLQLCGFFFHDCLGLLASKGHGCHVSTCVTFCNMPYMLGLENHSCTIHLGVGMRFIDY